MNNMNITLLAVCGLNPQVITETVYALAQQQRCPARIRVITTRKGRDAILSQLFDDQQGAWFALMQDLHMAPEQIDFGPQAVHALVRDGGQPIDDITSEADNTALVSTCLRLAWQAARHEQGAVFYSIAGGRKTMGAALGFAAQTYGRPQDRIFHVLVSPEFENSRNFFFPPTPPVEIELRDAKGQPYRKSTRYAQVQLVALPFFSFRSQLSADLLATPQTPATLLGALVRENPPALVILLHERKLCWQGRELDLPPTHLALYTLLAEIKKEALCAPDCPGCDSCWLTQAQLLDQQTRLSRIYRDLDPGRDPQEMSSSGIFGLTPDNFHSYRSKINRNLASGFGTIDAAQLQIGCQGRRPQTRYGLKLSRQDIRLVR